MKSNVKALWRDFVSSEDTEYLQSNEVSQNQRKVDRMEDTKMMLSDEDYRIVEDEEVMDPDIPPAYRILIKRSVVNTERYIDLLKAYKARKNGRDIQ